MKKYYIGVDIGGTSFKIGLVREDGTIINKMSYFVKNSAKQEEMIIELAHKILDFIKVNEIPLDNIVGVGIGCPGSINSKLGVCDYSNNLKWYDLKIVEILNKYINLPIKITNDANAATLGEYKFGVGKNYQNAIMLTLGTGVGGGVIINGKLYEGNDGKGAELGHSVIKLNGRKCTCGRKGCIEAYASASALAKEARSIVNKHKESSLYLVKDHLTGRIIFEHANKGDKVANIIIDKYCYYLKEAILNYCNIFRPDLIILGGGLSAQKEVLLSHIVPCMEKEHYGFSNTPKVELKCAELGNDAGIIGAASLLM